MFPERYRHFSSLSYNLKNGPHIERFHDRVWEEGINCQGLLHLFYLHVFQKELPSSLRSKELYEDETLFYTIRQGEIPRFGDVYLFGRENLHDTRKLHIAILIEPNNRLLLHATPIASGVAVWPIDAFFAHDRYALIYRIKRFKEELSLPTTENHV